MTQQQAPRIGIGIGSTREGRFGENPRTGRAQALKTSREAA
ncbi:MAG: hypothetical protein RLZZ598_1362 [Pseudomonadota bacterium]|jgi:hypothetical protein